MVQKESLNQATARQLRAERAASGMTLAQLVDASGIPERSLLRYLDGERAIKLEHLEALAGALGVSPAVILRRAIERNSEPADS